MQDSVSPQGIYIIEYGAFEMAMSHWVFPPVIYRQPDRVRLFDLGDTLWSGLSVEWLSDSSVRLQIRLYPGLVYCDLTLDLDTQTGQAVRDSYTGSSGQPGKLISEPPVAFEGSLEEIRQWLARMGKTKSRS